MPEVRLLLPDSLKSLSSKQTKTNKIGNTEGKSGFDILKEISI